MGGVKGRLWGCVRGLNNEWRIALYVGSWKLLNEKRNEWNEGAGSEGNKLKILMIC